MRPRADAALLVFVALVACGGEETEEVSDCWFDFAHASEVDELFIGVDCGDRSGVFVAAREDDTAHELVPGRITRVAPSRDGADVIITFANGVERYDIETAKAVRSFSNAEPGEVAVGPDADAVWVTLWNASDGEEGVALYDSARMRRQALIPLANAPVALALDASGRRVVSASSEVGDVIVIDASSLEIAATTETTGALDIAMSPDGARVAVIEDREHRVVLFDGDTLDVSAAFEVGPMPRQVAFSADGRTLFVTDRDEDTLRRFDVETHEALETIDLPGGPARLLITPYDTAVIGLVKAEQIVELDLVSGEIVRTL